MLLEVHFTKGEQMKQSTISPAKRKKIWRTRLFVISFLALRVLNFLVFYVYVNFDSFFMAFQRPITGSGFGATEWSLENFKTILNLLDSSAGGELLGALLNTVLFYVAGMVIGLPISVLMSYFIYKKIKGYKMFRFVTYLPNIITSSALVILFKNAVGPGGPLDALISAGGGEYIDLLTRNETAIWMIVFYSLSFGFGTNLIVLNGAMNGINKEMLEAASIDGCNWFQELIYVIIPTVWPTISTIVILSTAGFLGATGPILAFTKGTNGTMTLSFYIYQLVSGAGTGKQDVYLASAIGVVMTAISFPLALLVRKIVYGKEEA